MNNFIVLSQLFCHPRPQLLISMFFFSSRRRHTRSTRDWSSDVCSSDLSDHGIGLPVIFLHAFPLNRSMWEGEMIALLQEQARSEERRVGKSVDHRGGSTMKKKKNTKKRNTDDMKSIRSIRVNIT